MMTASVRWRRKRHLKTDMKLEDIRSQAVLRGILADALVSVVSVQWYGSEALELTYKTPSGKVANELLYRHDEARLEVVELGRPWSFDGDGALFRLVSEAQRIRLAHLFDPLLAVHASVVEPLPHQITAVYEAMLPRQPLRFLLADDPGAGKTIMAGREASVARAADTQAAAARARAIVMQVERGLGFEPTDREFEKLGYDIESRVPATGKLRFIEVKGRASGAATVTVTRNEILYSLNKPEDFILTIVEFLEDGEHRVHYLRQPFQREPDFGVTSVNYDFAELLARAGEPA